MLLVPVPLSSLHVEGAISAQSTSGRVHHSVRPCMGVVLCSVTTRNCASSVEGPLLQRSRSMDQSTGVVVVVVVVVDSTRSSSSSLASVHGVRHVALQQHGLPFFGRCFAARNRRSAAAR